MHIARKEPLKPSFLFSAINQKIYILPLRGEDTNNTSGIHNATHDATAESKKYHSVSSGRLNIVAHLLERGRKITLIAQVHDGFEQSPLRPCIGTPLYRTVENENPEYVRLLLNRGADRTIKGVMGMAPLKVAEMINCLKYWYCFAVTEGCCSGIFQSCT